ncbi:hypothetical protein F5B22DRAFT_539259 [Xylaria bambusicola]|uniref:uncharacterized protein n=1 Tax=Xylaria bambusicola TaxID=326684 RepID=UPI0020087FCC|nr:uncharacterized protein F5B22DRAFT_539259 [Xylaria bambusicola]KAI0521471.1 hypothetical protein F5B22DRAFT_539259 [Xylaria bambusicola]
MTTHVNASGRPTLAPLWTNSKGLGQRPTAAFRAAQGPLLSPSPMSAATVASPVYPISFDKALRRKDRALLDSLNHKTSPLSASSPKSLPSSDGQSPLVSKLEHASIHLTTSGEAQSPKSPEGVQDILLTTKESRQFSAQEDHGNIRTSDVFVIARSIRRNSTSAAEDSGPFWEAESSSAKTSHRLTLRAIVRPKSPRRQTFLIQRNLDIDELRATASASIAEKGFPNSSPLKANRKPLPVPSKWSSISKDPRTALSSSHAETHSRNASHSIDYDKLIGDSKTVPIHTHYTISALPALAILLTSGHIQNGDVIYLPVPHAESWPQTVRYIYTGRGELTTSMRENILYLGGRV